jgi:hypothetical protein
MDKSGQRESLGERELKSFRAGRTAQTVATAITTAISRSGLGIFALLFGQLNYEPEGVRLKAVTLDGERIVAGAGSRAGPASR